jgi:hypothetical protein
VVARLLDALPGTTAEAAARAGCSEGLALAALSELWHAGAVTSSAVECSASGATVVHQWARR